MKDLFIEHKILSVNTGIWISLEMKIISAKVDLSGISCFMITSGLVMPYGDTDLGHHWFK